MPIDPSKLDALLDQEDALRVRQAPMAAPVDDPDTMGRALQIGRERGLPPGVVAQNIGEYEQQQQADRAEALARGDRGLATWLSDPAHAVLAKDDHDGLANLQGTMGRAFARLKNAAFQQAYGSTDKPAEPQEGFRAIHAEDVDRTWGDYLADLGIAAKTSARSGLAGLVSVPRDATNWINTWFNAAANETAGLFGQTIAPEDNVQMFQTMTFGLEQYLHRSAEELNAEDRLRSGSMKQAMLEEERPEGLLESLAYYAKFPAMIGTDTAAAGGYMAAGGIVPGKAQATLITQALSQASGAVEATRARLVEKGADETTARTQAATVFGPAVAIGLLAPKIIPGGESIENLIAGKISREGSRLTRVAAPLLGEPISEGLEEGGIQAVQNVGAGDPLGQGVGAAVAMGAVVGHAMAAPAAVAGLAGEDEATEGGKPKKATPLTVESLQQSLAGLTPAQRRRGLLALTPLMEAAADSDRLRELASAVDALKTKARDRGAAEDLLQQMADRSDDVPSSLYVNAEQLVEYFQTQGEDPTTRIAELVGNEDALPDALIGSGDVVIPLGRFLTADYRDGILPLARTAPDRLSNAELGRISLDQVAAEFLGPEPVEAAPEPELTRIADEVTEIISATGRYGKPEAARYAKALAAAYQRRAGRLNDGRSAYDLFAQDRLSITSDAPGDVGQRRAPVDAVLDPLIDEVLANGTAARERPDGGADERFDEVEAIAAVMRQLEARGADLSAMGRATLRRLVVEQLDREFGQPVMAEDRARILMQATSAETAFALVGSRTFPTGRDLKLALQAMTRAAAKEARVDPSKPTDAMAHHLANMVVLDAERALATSENAVGWYNEKVTKALALIALIHPEVATDRHAKFAFVWALAVTSNGLKVDKNFELAETVYRLYRQTGRMGHTVGIGTAAGAINDSLALFDTLAARWGMDELERFMTTKGRVGDIIKASGEKIGGEAMGTEVFGAAILGPKIGNGFFANLYGHFGQLTMDRWLMRTWGRWTGTLIDVDPSAVKRKREQLAAVVRLLDPASRKALEQVIGARLSLGDLPGTALAIAKASQERSNRERMNAVAPLSAEQRERLVEILGKERAGAARFSMGEEVRKLGNSLAKLVDGQKEAPAGPKERDFIRRVFTQALAAMQRTRPALTMADLQAVLWYPEKRLYESAKGLGDPSSEAYNDDEAPDYANAAAALAAANGVPAEQIQATIQEVDNALRATDRAAGTRPDAGRGAGAAGAGAAAGTAAAGTGIGAADSQLTLAEWAEGSVVVDGSGRPLMVYRGTHGAGRGPMETRLGSIAFGSQAAAEIYATDPNDARESAQAPAVTPVYLRILNPVIDNRDDPFIEGHQLVDAIGEDAAREIVLRHAAHVENTNNWQEVIPEKYGMRWPTVAGFLAAHPEGLAELYLDAYVVFDDPLAVEAFKAAGFDGAVHVGNGETGMEDEYRIFDPSQARSALDNRTFYQLALPDPQTLEEALERIRALEVELRTDPLTGLRNRRAFDEDADLGWAEVVVLDLDGLKNLNDSLGLEAGDALIQQAAAVLLAAEREGEVRFYRQGGDEFTARFRDPGVAAALMAEVRDRLESVDLEIQTTDGTFIYSGIGAGYGIGQNFTEANAAEKLDKQARREAGLRQDREADGPPRRLRRATDREAGIGEGAQPRRVAEEFFQTLPGPVVTGQVVRTPESEEDGAEVALIVGGVRIGTAHDVRRLESGAVDLGFVDIDKEHRGGVGAAAFRAAIVAAAPDATDVEADLMSRKSVRAFASAFPSAVFLDTNGNTLTVDEAQALLPADFKPGRKDEPPRVYGSARLATSDPLANFTAPGTSGFDKWFGESKVVDENGEPLVVYHGTRFDFESFRPGAWFAENVNAAHTFIGGGRRAEPRAQKGSQIVPVYLSIQNPLDLTKLHNGVHTSVTLPDLFRLAGATEADFPRLLQAMEDEAKPERDRIGMSLSATSIPMLGKVGWTSLPEHATLEYRLKEVEPAWRMAEDRSVIAALKLLGIDGIKSTEARTYNPTLAEGRRLNRKLNEPAPSVTWLAFNPTQIKSIHNQGTFDPADPRTLFQSEVVFKSALVDALEQARGAPKKGDAAAWKGWLDGAQRRGEFRQGERDWLGVDQWLAKQGTVTREQLLAYVRANEVKVQDVVLGAPQAGTRNARQRELIMELERTYKITAEDDGDGGNDWVTLDDERIDFDEMPPAAAALAREWDALNEEELSKGGPVKFSEYQTPGGSNYRELLLTLPGDVRSHSGIVEFPNGGDDDVIDGVLTSISVEGMDGLDYGAVREDGIIEFDGWSDSEVERLRGFAAEFGGEVKVQETTGSQEGFRSSHFEQQNILAHVRFNERFDENGQRVLFLEEIQSDWHQTGRKEGYRVSGETPWQKLVKQGWRSGYSEEFGGWELYDNNGDPVGFGATEEEAIADFNQFDTENEGQRAALHAGGVPDAPLKATEEWAMLAFKRMVRWAAENGFDRIAWTTGLQQAERYKLSHKVSSIRVTSAEPGKSREVSLRVIEGNKPITLWVDDGGKVMEAHGVASDQFIGHLLSEVVGKDMADKILAAEAGEIFSGEQLDIGGKGMIGFYDKILPGAVNKWAKRFGAKVGAVKVHSGEAVSDREQELMKEDLEALARDANEYDFNEFAEQYESITGGLQVTEDAYETIGDLMRDPYSGRRDIATDFADNALAQVQERKGSLAVHGIDVTPEMRAAALESQALFQRKAASITFGADRTVIRLGDAANLSSLHHEFGHMFLEWLLADAFQPGADPTLREDLDAFLKWRGKSVRTAHGFANVRAAITRDDHEAFAEGYETYLTEGRAPSLALADLFARFRSWMLAIYGALRSKRVPIPDEMRRVYDRLYAADAEAEAASEMNGFQPLPDHVAGLVGDARWQKYQQTLQRAHDETAARLSASVLQPVYREATDAWRIQREAMQARVLAEAMKDPAHRARSILANGTLPDGSDAGMKPALDGAALKAEFGSAYVVERLRGLYRNEGGQPPEMVADLLGFASAQDLVEALVNTPPIKDYVAQEADRRMRERKPDPATDGSLPETAQKAAHGSRRLAALEEELAMVAELGGRPAPAPRVLGAVARRMVDTIPLRTLKPEMYLAAERKAAGEAMKALSKDRPNLALALLAKRRQVMNAHLYRAALARKASADRAYRYLARFNKTKKRAALGKVRGGYLEQIDALMEQLDLRPVSATEVRARASLLEFVKRAEARGESISVPPRLIDQAQRTPVRDLTGEQLQGIVDTVRQLDHLARVKGKLMLLGEERTRAQIDAANQASIRAAHGAGTPPTSGDITRAERARAAVNSGLGAYLNATSLARDLDGEVEGGAVWSSVVRPIQQANATTEVALREMQDRVAAIYLKYYSRKELRQLRKADYKASDGSRWSRERLMALAGNRGNPGNMEAILGQRAVPMPPELVGELLNQLDARDWECVRDLAQEFEVLWPLVAEREKLKTGLVPARVEFSAFDVRTRDGKILTMPGWYWPLVAETHEARADDRSVGEEVDEAFESMKLGKTARAQTRNGSAIERVGFGGRVVKLDLGVVQSKLRESLRDIHLGPAVNAVDRVLKGRLLRQAAASAGRSHHIRALQLWLVDVAAGEMGPRSLGESVVRRIRTNASMALMGFKVSTALIQPTGFAQSIPVVGEQWLAVGLKRMAEMHMNAFDYVDEVSPGMRLRGGGHVEQVAEVNRSLAGKAVDLQKHAWWMMSRTQRIVDVVTFLAAEAKGLQLFDHDLERARAYAFDAVERAQGSGEFIGKNALQRGTAGENIRQSEWVRSTTFMLGYMMAKGQIVYLRSRNTQFTNPREVGRWTADMLHLFVWEVLALTLLRGGWPDDDDDDGSSLDDFAFWLGKEVGGSVLGMVPGLAYLATDLRGYSPNTTGISAAKAFGNLWRNLADGDLDKADAKAVSTAAGVAFGFPSSQTNVALDAIFRAHAGEDVPVKDFFVRPPEK